MASKRRYRADEGWYYEDELADDVEEWEAQADGTFTKLQQPKAADKASDQLVQLNMNDSQLDHGNSMDEDEDEDPEDAGVDGNEEAGEEVANGRTEGEARQLVKVSVYDKDAHEKQEGAEAKEERPHKRAKVDEDEL